MNNSKACHPFLCANSVVYLADPKSGCLFVNQESLSGSLAPETSSFPAIVCFVLLKTNKFCFKKYYSVQLKTSVHPTKLASMPSVQNMCPGLLPTILPNRNSLERKGDLERAPWSTNIFREPSLQPYLCPSALLIWFSFVASSLIVTNLFFAVAAGDFLYWKAFVVACKDKWH